MGKKKMTGWTDKEVFSLIRKETDANDIIEITTISRGTLQKKVLIAEKIDKKYYDIKGLTEEAKPIRMTKNRCIFITSPHLSDSDFETGDEFAVSFQKNKVILTKV